MFSVHCKHPTEWAVAIETLTYQKERINIQLKFTFWCKKTSITQIQTNNCKERAGVTRQRTWTVQGTCVQDVKKIQNVTGCLHTLPWYCLKHWMRTERLQCCKTQQRSLTAASTVIIIIIISVIFIPVTVNNCIFILKKWSRIISLCSPAGSSAVRFTASFLAWQWSRIIVNSVMCCKEIQFIAFVLLRNHLSCSCDLRGLQRHVSAVQ